MAFPDSKLTSFNVNLCVRVQLTDFGRKVLYEHHERLVKFVFSKNPKANPIPFKIDEDAGGWSRWQLWSLMAHFGPYMSSVTPLPFHPDILIED
jgi:hypothetical protein